jgi:hypothetical protein
MTCVVRSFPGCQRPKRHEGMRQRMEAGPGRGKRLAARAGLSFWRNAVRARAPLRRRLLQQSLLRPPQRPRMPLSQALCSHSGSPRLPLRCRRRIWARPRPQGGEFTTELQARAHCPSDTVVWVNTPTRIYHYSGTRYYGHTRRGVYMCEADARAAGYRATRSRQREAIRDKTSPRSDRFGLLLSVGLHRAVATYSLVTTLRSAYDSERRCGRSRCDVAQRYVILYSCLIDCTSDKKGRRWALVNKIAAGCFCRLAPAREPATGK